MISTTTIYEGSLQCPCGVILTPLEAIFSREVLCQSCRAEVLDDLIRRKMVG